MLGYVCLTLNT